jgi:hypothetical protein
MTVCRYEMNEKRVVEKENKKDKKNAGHNIQKIIQQTNLYLQPPVIKDV